MLSVQNLGQKISDADLFEVRTLNNYGLGTSACRYSFFYVQLRFDLFAFYTTSLTFAI